MNLIELSEADARALLARLPDPAIILDLAYRDGVLHVPDDHLDRIEQARSPAAVAGDLDRLKAERKAAIDAAAKAERLKYITPGSGQAMTYARKVEQAKAAQADAEPELGDYPLLAASIGIDGGDVLAVAATVLAMDAAWEQIGAAIEAARLNGKHAVDLAETAEAARAVEVIWPSP